jgi:hypothetical protein
MHRPSFPEWGELRRCCVIVRRAADPIAGEPVCRVEVDE